MSQGMARPIAMIVTVLGLVTSSTAVASTPPGDGASDGPRARVSFVRTVSGPTPFTDNCGFEGQELPDREAEPHIAVNPRNPNHLLATWQQDRYLSGGGARSNLAAVSRNGGRSWRVTTLPGISACTGGERARATDPWTTIGADGTAHVVSMALTTGAATGEGDLGQATADVVVSGSRNGGASWDDAVAIAEDDGQFFHEKPLVRADPHSPGTLYAAWARHLIPDPAPYPLGAVDVAAAFSRSDDGGRTWSDPVPASPDLPWVNEWPEAILTLPPEDGHTPLVVVGGAYPTRAFVLGCSIYATRSDDGGQTWSLPVLIAKPVFDGDTPPFFVYDLERFQGYRVSTCVSSSAVAPDGTVYVAWFERTPDGDVDSFGGSEIRFARSEDGGATWTGGVAARSSRMAFLPTLAVAGDGTVGITYLDTSEDRFGDEELTARLRFVSSGDRGETWERIDLSGPVDLSAVPQGYMLGDYDGLVGLPDGFGALVALPGPIAERGITDIFYVRITLDGATR